MADTVADVVVIGAGVMGSSAAWQLARRGKTVSVIEQFEPLHHLGSSHGATRIFRVSYRHPTYVELALEALVGWRELERISGEHLLEQTGQLDHGIEAVITGIADNLERAGFPGEQMTATEAHRRWPHLRFDRAVLHSPDGGRVFAERTLRALHRLSSELGVGLSFRETVRSIERTDNGVVVHTDHRTVRAELAVVAAGAWVRELVPADVPMPPVTVVTSVPVHFRPRDASQRWPSFLHHRDASAGELAFGAYGLESPGEGVKVGVDGATTVSEVAEYVSEWHPGLAPTPTSSASCLFTSTADEHFVIERHGPIVICSPCSGHGFKFAPVIGRLVAELCDGQPARYAFAG